MTDASAVFVEYRVRWKTSGLRPGAFRGINAGSGDHIRTSVPLREHADPRRLDIRASLRDPFGGLWVREFEQNSALKVIVLADVSASMGYVGRYDKLEQLRRIAVALAQTAWRNGDAFGFYAAGEAPEKRLMLPVRVNRGAGEWIERRLDGFVPQGASARGLVKLVPHLPHRRALVFVVSDFHWPEGDLDALMRSLAHHAVVPVVLWDPAEAETVRRHGIAVLRDLESGERRFVWLRPGLVAALHERRRRREHDLRQVCRAAGSAPFFVRGRFDPALLTQHFLETPA
ncbi:MAG TPA: DUF58 domain-containing protein [Rhodanobacteraceae bacterium]|nr:DUF58 domain-containing protein [Rhodanobacteraceae bacterium]